MFNLAKSDGKLRDVPHFPMFAEAKPRKGTLAARLGRVPRKGRSVRLGDFRKALHGWCVKPGLGRLAWACSKPDCARHNQPLAEADEAPRCAACGRTTRLKYFGLLFHDLRRTFVTDGEHAGAPRHEIMKITGHKSEAVKRYAIENRERRREALKEVAAYRAARNGEISAIVNSRYID